jgi:hypothetical protein
MKPFEVRQAGLLRAEPVEELVPVAWVVFTCVGGCYMLDAHPVVPALLELTGYPLYIYSLFPL